MINKTKCFLFFILKYELFTLKEPEVRLATTYDKALEQDQMHAQPNNRTINY